MKKAKKKILYIYNNTIYIYIYIYVYIYIYIYIYSDVCISWYVWNITHN